MKRDDVRSGRPARLAWTATALLAALPWFPASASHSWDAAHWSRTSTLTIRLADNVGSAWDTHLRNVATDWSYAAPLDTVVVAGSNDPLRCDPTYGRVEVCNARYGDTGWLGIGQIWTSGGHIVQGTAKLNDTYYSEPRYNTTAWRRTVSCQEIGHTLGLDHQDVIMTNLNLGSCMDYTNDPSGTKGTNGTLHNMRPNTHDRAQLATIYKHTDSSQLSSTKAMSSAAAAAPAGEQPRLSRRVGNSPGEWGRSVARDSRGRPRVFVRDLGGGVELATFVIWADDGHQDGHTH